MKLKQRLCGCGQIEGIPDDIEAYECRNCGQMNQTGERYCFDCESRVEHISLPFQRGKCAECGSQALRL